MIHLPEELKKIRQWTYSFSEKELKRPTHTKYTPEGGLNYEEALEKAGPQRYVGFYATLSDRYLLLDIDHVENPNDPWSELPVDLADFIRSNPTYVESSPSGKGIRAIFKLHGSNPKRDIDGSYVKYRGEWPDASPEDQREAQINFGPPWQTITGNSLPWAVSEIAEVTLDNLQGLFPIRVKTEREAPLVRNVTQEPPKDTLSDVAKVLMTIPLDQNPRIKRTFKQIFNVPYTHYDFWVKILMALHNYGMLADKNIECLELAIQWSKTDTTHFESEEDVAKHWRSFSSKEEIISYKTLFRVGYGIRLFWPVPKKRSQTEIKKNIAPKPMISEYLNFKSLIDYYDLRFFRDSDNPNLVYLTGDQDILEKYFIMYNVECHYSKYYGPFTTDTLIPAFHIMMQQIGFRGLSHNQTKTFIKNYLAETRQTVNMIRMYFDTPYDKLPEEYKTDQVYHETTTFDKLFSCLMIDYSSDDKETEYELYKAYYKKWLMGLIRSLYYRETLNISSCVMLLTGPEQIRKTSHFRFLLPPFMKDKIAFTTHGFSTDAAMRDVSKLSSTNLIMVWDELEQYLNSDTESNFKKIIDGNPQKIIDKYEVVDKVIQPIAIYGATSNQTQFNLGSEGSRRLFHIPVKWVDTDSMKKICWHKLINDLKTEAEWGMKIGQVPWMLNEKQLEIQRRFHSRIRAKNSIDMMLEEVFDFSNPITYVNGGHSLTGIKSIQSDKSGRLMTTKEVNDLLIRAGFSMTNVKRPALVRSLERLCGEYTGTSAKAKELTHPVCHIKKGLATQHQYKKWVMPEIQEEMKKVLQSKFKQFE